MPIISEPTWNVSSIRVLVSTIIVFPISLSSCEVPGFFTMAGTRYGIIWCESFCRNSRKLVKPNARTIRCTDVPKLRPPIWWLSTTKFTINCEKNMQWQHEPHDVQNTSLKMCTTIRWHVCMWTTWRTERWVWEILGKTRQVVTGGWKKMDINSNFKIWTPHQISLRWINEGKWGNGEYVPQMWEKRNE